MTHVVKPFGFVGENNIKKGTIDQRAVLKKRGESDPKDSSVPESASGSPDDLVQLPVLKKSEQAEDSSTSQKSPEVPAISPLVPSVKTAPAEKVENQ